MVVQILADDFAFIPKGIYFVKVESKGQYKLTLSFDENIKEIQ